MNDDATDLGNAGFGLMFYNARWYVTSTQGQDQNPQNLVWSAAIVNVDGSNRITFVFGSNINWKP